MSDALPPHQRFTTFDGRRIAYRVLGEGPPVLVLHGFLADAALNWFAPGIAQAMAAAGFRVVAPDLRGHGGSDAPEEAAAYPPDVLALDQEALLAHLGLGTAPLLVGYSLGARTAVRLMARGLTPPRTVLGGMGDDGVLASAARRAYFEDAISRGEQAADPRAGRFIQAMMVQRGLQAAAMLGVLGSFVPTSIAQLAAMTSPTLVVSGEADADNGSAEGLAALMPQAQAVRVPGDHLSAVAEPALAQAIVTFLKG